MDAVQTRILLVEDEAIIAMAQQQQLERYAYSVELAVTGEEAIRKALRDDAGYAVVLMDIDLGPGIDGTETAEAILQARDIPIVFLSSHTEPAIVGKTERITSYGYVVKNSGIVILDASIKMALKLFQEKMERKKAESNLKKLEWMLSTAGTVAGSPPRQEYEDPTALNTEGCILRSVGHERLKDLSSDYLDLLGSSSAIYERNGDYAFGIFASGWCRMMDSAARRLCGTTDNRAALDSGRWLCHESCWTACSSRAIKEGGPVDIACNGGIRLYAVPIVAGGEIIGAINFGYGDPPKDPRRLQELAERYQVSCEDLLRESDAYDSRPPFIIDLAKKRLHATARLIGSMVEARQAEDALRRSESIFKKVFEILPIGLWIADSQGTLMQGNPAGVAIWGMEPKVGQDEYGVFKARRLPSREEIAPDDWALAHSVNRGVTVVDELLEIDAFDGTTKTILNYTAPILDGSGAVEGAIVVNQDITDRKRAEEEIRRQLEEKENLLCEVHHRIKNNMASIEGLLSLQVESIKNPEVIEALQDSLTRIQSMRILYDRLLVDKNFHDIRIKPYVEGLVDSISAVYAMENRIRIRRQISDCSMDSRKATALGIMINEILTNAFKHAFAGRCDGVVSITLERSGNTVTLIIQDNGTGIDEALLRTKPDSLGLAIVSMLARQLKGTHSLTREEGTRFFLQFEA